MIQHDAASQASAYAADQSDSMVAYATFSMSIFCVLSFKRATTGGWLVCYCTVQASTMDRTATSTHTRTCKCIVAGVADGSSDGDQAEAVERRDQLMEDIAENEAAADRYRADIAANEQSRREIQQKIESAIDTNNNANFLKILSTFRIQVGDTICMVESADGIGRSVGAQLQLLSASYWCLWTVWHCCSLFTPASNFALPRSSL